MERDGPVRKTGLSYQPVRLYRRRNRFLGIDFWAPQTFTHSRRWATAQLNRGAGRPTRVGILSTAMGRGIDSRNRVWNWVAKLHRLPGRYDNPVVPSLHIGTKVTDTGYIGGGIDSLESISGLLKRLQIRDDEPLLNLTGAQSPAYIEGTVLYHWILKHRDLLNPFLNTRGCSVLWPKCSSQ